MLERLTIITQQVKVAVLARRKMAVSSRWTWSDFIRRCRSRSLGWDDLPPLSNRVIIPWFIFCGLGLALIDTEEGLFKSILVPFTWICLWISVFGFLSYCGPPKKPLNIIKPLLLGLVGFSPKSPLEIKSIIWMIAWPVVVGVVYAYMTIGIFLWVNALAGSHETVLVHGPVIAKAKGGSSRYGGVASYLTITFEHRLVSLKVPQREYEQMRVGDEYAVKMKRGALGYFYRWPKAISG